MSELVLDVVGPNAQHLVQNRVRHGSEAVATQPIPIRRMAARIALSLMGLSPFRFLALGNTNLP